MNPLITIDQASRLTGRTHGAIKNWLSKGHVRGFKDSKGAWLIARDEIIDRHNSIRRVGNSKPPIDKVQGQLIALPAPETAIPEQDLVTATLLALQVSSLTVALAVLRHQVRSVPHEHVKHLADDLAWLLERASG